ncbi:DUF1778 domain-containing protein [Pseudomonas sp. RP23018S]|uniref:type II toxin-antitoxin system TacA family antitoxin n=1 Tax=Pseudomonas sp. RP23018S TaxID=3096037 RepID=UPI002ACA9EC2|nr:DUF1778 domain-containing protein [Pseudomonas sp. RP23018S]MDZ5604319.1 DUF1778 domain-containing protein [Pseudomonas sp. RP23018S]
MSSVGETLQGAKTARLDLKTTEFAKEVIRKAAIISGLDMTSFIVASAFEKAEAVLESHQRIEISEKAFARAHELSIQAMNNPKAHKNLVELLRQRNEKSQTGVRPSKPE